MCGIAGIVGKMDANGMPRMLKALHRRGPNHQGFHSTPWATVGMTRLAILDTSPSGHQPMKACEDKVLIVYNGEMYNHQDQRIFLESKGVSFHSSSDTEVVLQLYLYYGDEFLKHVHGIFALAILDVRKGRGKERLLLARDPMGVKPLLYSGNPQNFVFASEMKALLASGKICKDVDPEALRQLLSYGSIQQPRTMFRDVHMLPAGCYMTVRYDSMSITTYWSMAKFKDEDRAHLPYEEQKEILSSALADCVRRQIVSDVPVGGFLSGGVDSSVMVALMRKYTSGKIKTFSIGFESGSSSDETTEAHRTAQHLQTEHHTHTISGTEAALFLPQIVEALDQPTIDGANSFFVSSLAAQHVSVAISGTGGDELFTGYPWFNHMYLWEESRKNRFSCAASLKERLGKVLSHDSFNALAIGRWSSIVEGIRAEASFCSAFCRQYYIFSAKQTSDLLSLPFRKQVHSGREPSVDFLMADVLNAETAIRRTSGLCLRGYTLNQLLRDIDVTSMYHSLEVRVPYLDPEIVLLGLSLSDQAKLSNPRALQLPGPHTYDNIGAKRILIDIARDLLPAGFENQVKRGFSLPFGEWLKGPIKSVLDETLSESAVSSRGLLNPVAVRQVHRDFNSGVVGWSHPWLLMMIELWCRRFLDNKQF